LHLENDTTRSSRKRLIKGSKEKFRKNPPGHLKESEAHPWDGKTINHWGGKRVEWQKGVTITHGARHVG